MSIKNRIKWFFSLDSSVETILKFKSILRNKIETDADIFLYNVLLKFEMFSQSFECLIDFFQFGCNK